MEFVALPINGGKCVLGLLGSRKTAGLFSVPHSKGFRRNPPMLYGKIAALWPSLPSEPIVLNDFKSERFQKHELRALEGSL
jgi:hypothetical protein